MINNYDKYLKAAATIIVEKQMPSITLIQRKFRIGFNRAGRIMSQLEQIGIIDECTDAPRNLLVNSLDDLEEKLKSFDLGDQTMSDPCWDKRDWV